jgi:lactoylglutathione lyase
MTAQQGMTRAQMDALVDGHYRAEEAGDLDAIVEGLAPDAEHDVVGRFGDPLHGGEQIADFYRFLLAVFVPVSNQDEALKFYTEKLGFEIRTDAAYEENQRWLEVSPPGAETTIALVPPREGHQDPEGIDTNVGFGTDDVAAAHADLSEKGVHTDDIISPGNAVPSMFFFRDEDGNKFVIAEESD